MFEIVLLFLLIKWLYSNYIFLQIFTIYFCNIFHNKNNKKINNQPIVYFEKNPLHDLRILDGEISMPKSRNLIVDDSS